jgi:prenyl protein peptidase
MIFGLYSSFVFLKTRSLVSIVILHGYCNFMGFPNFGELFSRDFDIVTKSN